MCFFSKCLCVWIFLRIDRTSALGHLIMLPSMFEHREPRDPTTQRPRDPETQTMNCNFAQDPFLTLMFLTKMAFSILIICRFKTNGIPCSSQCDVSEPSSSVQETLSLRGSKESISQEFSEDRVTSKETKVRFLDPLAPGNCKASGISSQVIIDLQVMDKLF